MASYSKEETVVKNSLIKRTSSLLGKLNRRTSHRSRSGDDHTENLKDLEEQVSQIPVTKNKLKLNKI